MSPRGLFPFLLALTDGAYTRGEQWLRRFGNGHQYLQTPSTPHIELQSISDPIEVHARDTSLRSIVWRRRAGRAGGCDVSLYRSVANAVGTREALELAPRLAAWHDAMVMHRRRTGDAASLSCDVDCPHEHAESLWLEAVDVYGERAHEFAFLRSFRSASNPRENVALSELHL
jgi:hypothetical protein